MRFLSFLFLILVVALPARAEIFVWQDPGSELSLTFPDTWSVSHNQKPGDVLTIWAPGVNEFASCRMRVRDDKRFTLYPRRYDASIQRVNVSREFWADYLGEFDRVVLHSAEDNGGLGLAFASRADFSFVPAAGPKVQKRGFAYAGIYNDKLFAFECSADYQAYPKWNATFRSVLKSIQLRMDKQPFVGGHYRAFMGDSVLKIETDDPSIPYTW